MQMQRAVPAEQLQAAWGVLSQEGTGGSSGCSDGDRGG